MASSILEKVAIVVFFWTVVLSNQEFLEYYQPRPDFPKELNDWLAYVQGHRNDFRIIRNIVKRRKAEVDYYDEKEADNKLLSDLEGVEEETPQNDIYPRSNLAKKEKNYDSNLKTQNKSKRKLNKPIRTRRESDENSFFEHRNSIEIDPKSKIGEIKRPEAKYPDQFIHRGKEDKREIQIDILNDGKLLKSIKENNKEPKSIVLNIQNVKDPPPALSKDNQPNPLDPHVIPVNSPQRSIENDNANNKEAASNFKNLFTVNEKLNTDSSVARDAFAKNALVYHVSLPNPNFIVPHDSPNGTDLNENNFQRNNFRDMSKYWSDSEKNQLQQGIQFAQETGNLRKQKTNDGFETARTIVVEHVANRPVMETQQDGRLQMKRNLETWNGKVQFGGPIISTRNEDGEDMPFEELENKMKSNIEDTRQVSFPENEYNPINHNNGRKHNRIIIVTDRITNGYLEPHSECDNPTAPKKIDENINNHISITIVEPQKDEEPEEETKNEEHVPLFATFPNPISEEFLNLDSTKDSECTNNPEYRAKQQLNQKFDFKNVKLSDLVNTTTKESNNPEYDENSENIEDNSCETGQCLDDKQNMNNNIETHIEPNYENVDSKVHAETKYDNNDSQIIQMEPKYENYNGQIMQMEPKNDNHNNQMHLETKYENIDRPMSNNENPDTQMKVSSKYDKPHKQEHDEGDIRVSIEPQPGKSHPQMYKDQDHKRYLSRQRSPEIMRLPPLGNNAQIECQGPNCNEEEPYCEGPNCRSFKNLPKSKHKRNRGKRRHRHRHNYENSANDYISAYKIRQLKAVNYNYDADLEEASDAVVSSERTKRLGANKKEYVEGDYGDEEDSVSLKSNVSSKLIKKVDNIFANPHTTCEPDDEDYYYDDIDEKDKNIKKIDDNNNNNIKDQSTSLLNSEDDKVSLGRRQHKKSKVHQKQSQGKDISKVSQTQIREPRASEDLAQLPKFVITDDLNEENLRKRSLAQKKEVQKNKFPLSSKSFFPSNNVKRRDSSDADIFGDKASAAPGADKTATVADSLGGGTGNGGDSKETSDALGQTEPAVSVATDECESSHVSIGPVCETDNFTKVKVTTMLNLIGAGENQQDLNNSLPSINEQYQNLEDILVGRLPLSIVDSVFKHMKMHPTFKQRFFRGMKKKNAPVSFKNLPEISSKESNKLIRLMSKIINRLQWTTTCQILPNKLKRYLKTITSVKIEDRLTKTKAMEEIELAENQNQTSFIFHSNNGVDNVEEKVRVLKNMLIKYQHLPESCKPRAEPVKEYIENHLDMLTHAMSSNMAGNRKSEGEGPKESVGEVPHHEAAKRNEKDEDTDLIEHELESLGLGKHPNFRPNFDLETLLRSPDRSGDQAGEEDKNLLSKKTSKRSAVNRETSDQYDRLLEAVKKERIKREGRKRIAAAFGKLSVDDYKGTNSNNAINEVFENPLVYSF